MRMGIGPFGPSALRFSTSATRSLSPAATRPSIIIWRNSAGVLARSASNRAACCSGTSNLHVKWHIGQSVSRGEQAFNTPTVQSNVRLVIKAQAFHFDACAPPAAIRCCRATLVRRSRWSDAGERESRNRPTDRHLHGPRGRRPARFDRLPWCFYRRSNGEWAGWQEANVRCPPAPASRHHRHRFSKRSAITIFAQTWIFANDELNPAMREKTLRRRNTSSRVRFPTSLDSNSAWPDHRSMTL